MGWRLTWSSWAGSRGTLVLSLRSLCLTVGSGSQHFIRNRYPYRLHKRYTEQVGLWYSEEELLMVNFKTHNRPFYHY